LLAQVNELASSEHRGPEVRESAAAKAEGIIREELRRLGGTVDHLQARRKGDPQKVSIAGRLRGVTTMTLAWIAAQLNMGTPSHVACLLYRQKKIASNETSENTLF